MCASSTGSRRLTLRAKPSKEEMRQAMLHYLEKARTLAEGAGAAPLAAALKCRDRIRGKNVVLYLSGGNESRATLVRALTDPDPW